MVERGSASRRAAANSSASGRPSSWTTSSATSAAVLSLRMKSARRARARSTKSATDGICASASGDGNAACKSGTASGGTRSVCSQRSCSGTRLVTSRHRPGQLASKSASAAPAGSTCSKLSSTSSSAARSRRTSRSRSGSGGWPVSVRPRVRAMAGSTRDGSRTGARSTRATPSANRSASCAAAARARRVLPTPAGPVSVSRRAPSSDRRRWIVASSAVRPISGVGWAGTGERVARAMTHLPSRSLPRNTPQIPSIIPDTRQYQERWRTADRVWRPLLESRPRPYAASCSTVSLCVQKRDAHPWRAGVRQSFAESFWP